MYVCNGRFRPIVLVHDATCAVRSELLLLLMAVVSEVGLVLNQSSALVNSLSRKSTLETGLDL